MVTVGVEIAKATREAATWQDGRAVRLGTFEQTPAGWTALRDALAGWQTAPADTRPATDREPVAMVLEPTGGYALAFALWARQQASWQVHRPNPARVRAGARSQGLRAQTDRQEALLLARFGARAPPALPVWQALASEVRALEQVRRRRDEVADWLQRERRRYEQLGVRPDASTTVRASWERLLTTLAGELADLERAITDHAPRHAELRAGEERWRTVPGVGARIALPLLVTCER
jgi:transposase